MNRLIKTLLLPHIRVSEIEKFAGMNKRTLYQMTAGIRPFYDAYIPTALALSQLGQMIDGYLITELEPDPEDDSNLQFVISKPIPQEDMIERYFTREQLQTWLTE